MMKNKGIIPINKPSGWTSFDVVNKIKHMVYPNKVGHLGTLDPMATGVLLVVVGKATRLFDIMQEKTKTYVATFEFGYETDTLDSTGKITENNEYIPTMEEIEKVLPEFIGKINQIPPKYSAKSINGVRAYDLARKGIEFDIPAKMVEIQSIEILDYKDKKLILEIKCGSGTYIRSIGRDIAYKLNTLATMTELVRTKVGSFDILDCYEIEQINKDNIENQLIKIDKILDYPIIELSEIERKKLLNGLILDLELADGIYKLNNEFDTQALVKIKDFKAKMFLFID